MDEDSDVRPLPHDDHAERVVLSGILREPHPNRRAFGELGVDDFYAYAHRLVYDAALSLWQAFEPVGLVEVYEELRRRGVLADLGPNPAAWLADVYETDPTGFDCLHAAAELKRYSLRRSVVLRATEMMVDARTGRLSNDEYAAMLTGHSPRLGGRVHPNVGCGHRV